MNRAEQEELKRIVEALENDDYYSYGDSLKADTDFQALKRMATAERHPIGEPNRVTALKWEELSSMEDEARGLNAQGYTIYASVIDTIKTEKKRRLLELLPNDKTE